MTLSTLTACAARYRRSPVVPVLLGALLAPGVPALSAADPSVEKSVKVGSGLYELAVDEKSNTVYVASTAKDMTKIFLLDAKSLAEKDSIAVSETAYGLGINNKTGTLYTSNTRTGSVSVIDTKTNKVLKTIKAPGEANAHLFRVLVDEDTNTVYVTSPGAPSKVWVIDGKTNEVAHVLTDVGSRSTGLSVDNDAKRLFVSSMGTNEIVVVDLNTKQVVNKFPTGGERPTQQAFDRKGKRLFVTHQGSGGVVVLDSTSGNVIKSIKTGEGALGIGFNPKNDRLYVANRMAGTVTVVDTKTYETVADLKTGTLPNTIAIDSKTGKVYVTNKARRMRPPAAGQPAPPPAEDTGGDTVTLINP